MIILPSIDIKDGRCVRLYQGNYDQMTTYHEDPVQVACHYQDAGASWLHIVDLDGALQGHPRILDLIRHIRSATSMHLEVGGGMRTLDQIEQVLDLGVDRVVLGTVVITDPTMALQALQRWQEQIVIGIDARNGWVAISGWCETSQVQATALATQWCAAGAQRFVYTDIGRDCTLAGPNLGALAEMHQVVTPYALIASGGVGSFADLKALEALGVEGVILGKSIYTGDVDLAMTICHIEKKALR